MFRPRLGEWLPGPNDPQYRVGFLETEIALARREWTNPHKTNAAERSTVYGLFRGLSHRWGRTLYSVSGSTKDMFNGISVDRPLIDAKDHTKYAEERADPVPAAPLYQYIDVASHMTESELSRRMVDASPHVMYTWNPTAVAGRCHETAFRYAGDGSWEFSTPQAAYRHPLWSYEGDVVSLRRHPAAWAPWFWWIACTAVADGPGAAATTALFGDHVLADIVRRDVSEHRAAVLLLPRRRFRGWAAFWNRQMLSDCRLQRLVPDVLDNGIMGMRLVRVDGVHWSFGNLGQWSAVTVPDIVMSDLRSTIRLQKNLPSGGMAVKLAMDAGVKITAGEGNILVAAAMGTCPTAVASFALREEPAAKSYTQSPGPDYVYPANKIMRSWMRPLVSGRAYLHENNVDCEAACEYKRITSVRNAVAPAAVFNEHLAAFVSRLTRELRATVRPASDDTILAQVKRPSQLRGIQDGLAHAATITRDDFKQFLKKESYPEVKDPRPITQASAAVGVEYSRYIIPMAEVLKDFNWYAFGRTPREISQMVPDLLEDAESVCLSDFSRFDGRVSEFLRRLELEVGLALLDPAHHEGWRLIHSLTYNNVVRTAKARKYLQKYARASGLRDTSLWNTIINAFVAFCALRQQTGSYDAAWEMLGLYGGDDGFTPGLDSRIYAANCDALGLVTKASMVARGEPVVFLSRVWGPYVWWGDPNNMTDPLRALVKFHLTALPNTVNDDNVAVWKARSYLATDANTPILGHMCRIIATHFGDHLGVSPADLGAVDLVTARFGPATYNGGRSVPGAGYVNVNADWMWEYLHDQIGGPHLGELASWVDGWSLGDSWTDHPTLDLEELEQPADSMQDGVYRPPDNYWDDSDDASDSSSSRGRGKRPASQAGAGAAGPAPRNCVACGAEIARPVGDSDVAKMLQKRWLKWTHCRDCKQAKR